MTSKVRATPAAAWAAPALLTALLVLAGCGGDSAEPTPVPTQEVQSFGQRAASLAAGAQGAEGTAPALSGAAQAEVQRISREWAVAAITTPGGPMGSVMTAPPLQFGLVLAVDAAASGATRSALRAQWPATEPATEPTVQAALQSGLERQVRAAAGRVLDPVFLDRVLSTGQARPWSSLTLLPLSPQQLAAEPNLRLAITDTARGEWAWPQATAYDGVHTLPGGSRVIVPMIRVQGPVLEHAGSGFEASSMAAGNGHWLVRVVPQATPAVFGAAGLSQALAAVVPTLTAEAAAAAAPGTWRLPVASTTSSVGLDDRRGMALAMDKVNADLRRLDGGGAYLKAPVGGGSLTVGASGVSYRAAQSFEFIFSPLNIFGPGFQSGSSIVMATGVNIFSQPPCPTEPADVRPYFLAWVQPSGNIAMLARLETYGTTACGGVSNFIQIVPPAPTGP